jgi:isocitrate dehydrogenase (NAD+)
MKVVLIKGDGIGPEISDAVVKIFEAAKADIQWIEAEAGEKSYHDFASPLPPKTIDLIKEHRFALKGPLTTPIGNSATNNFKSANLAMRQALDLYANLRPIKSIPAVKSRYENIDIVIIRENTEGLYSGLEHNINADIAVSMKIASRKACERIGKFAFEFARKNSRKKITAVHKANIIKLTDGLMLECFRKIAADYPEISYDEKIVDAVSMSLVMNPEQFDIILTENLYGDILSDLCAGLIGGLGIAPSANIGENCQVFEAIHGSAPDIAGKGLANPTALLLAAISMLRQLGQASCADKIMAATLKTLADKNCITKDLGGNCSTMEFASHIVNKL